MYPIITENEKIRLTEQYFTMPDGVRLYTRIAVPKGKMNYPIVFMRTPYEEAHNGAPHHIAQYDTDLFLQNGYTVVLQHCRGRGDSEGFFAPYDEREDGLASLALIRQLDIYNGEIYLSGESYLSTVHLSYLDTNPSDIKGAVLSIQTDRMYFRNYRNGCNFRFCNYGWWLSMLKKQFPDLKRNEPVKRPYKNMMKQLLGEEYPPFTDMLLHDTYDDFWKNDPRTYAIDGLQIPVLFVEGWYDFYTGGMFSMWERLPEKTRKQSVFMVGPWGHGTSVSDVAEYPLPNGDLPDDYIVRWFNSLRYGETFPYADVGKVTYYNIGSGSWEKECWPPADGKPVRLYFADEGTLNATPSEKDREITYIYDPERTIDCFRYLSIFRAAEAGTVDGVISMFSQPVEEDVDFFGKIRWHMCVRSDCDDSAFFIRVYFEEDGTAYNLTETITTLSHIKEDYQAGDRLTIDLLTPPIGFHLKKGSRLRVDISSHSGDYVPHANVKGHWAEVCETKIAQNTLYLKDAFIELNQVTCEM